VKFKERKLHLREDTVYKAISKFLEAISDEDVDRIVLDFTEDGVEVEIAMSEVYEDIAIDEMLDLESDEVLMKTMATSLLMTEFKGTLIKFLNDIDDVMEFGDKWAEVLNMIFNDVSKKKNYLIQVIKR
jgi:hypothetical protein